MLERTSARLFTPTVMFDTSQPLNTEQSGAAARARELETEVEAVASSLQPVADGFKPGDWVEVKGGSYEGEAQLGGNGQIESFRVSSGALCGNTYDIVRNGNGVEGHIIRSDYQTDSIDEPGVHKDEEWFTLDGPVGSHKSISYSTF